MEESADFPLVFYQHALSVNPKLPDELLLTGNLLKDLRRPQDAIAYYLEAIKYRPNFALAYGNMAAIYLEHNDHATAVNLYWRALHFDSSNPDLFNNLGNALKSLGDLDQSILCYRRALELDPRHASAYNNLGNAFKEKGMPEHALQCYSLALVVCPRFAAVHSNLANLLQENNRMAEALVHYRTAIAIDPCFADVHSNLGNALKACGYVQEAIHHYTEAIRLNPCFADAWSNLGSTYKDAGRVDYAITHYRRALALKPDFPDALANLVHSLQMVCDWRDRTSNMELLMQVTQRQLKAGVVPSVQPHHALFYNIPWEMTLAIAMGHANRIHSTVAHLIPPSPLLEQWDCLLQYQPGERLRIGYVSSDFCNHPLAHLMQSVFGMHNKDLVEVFCYAIAPDDNSEYRRKIATEAEHFVDLTSMAILQAAHQIRHVDRIHILINLNGYTAKAWNEIFAMRPAPLQVLYMGFPGSMAAPAYIQFMVADAVVIPPKYAHRYSENVLYMPNYYFVNDHKQSFATVLDTPARRSDLGLPEDKFIFYNPNQLWKIDPPTLDVWANILRRVPNSVLWLLRFPAAGESYMRNEARMRGIPDHQIIFSDVMLKQDFIRKSQLADLFLDTPLCNGHTTGVDVLWAGVPMLTLPQQSMSSRVAASLCRAIGLPQMAVKTWRQYEDTAVDWATTGRAKLHKLRKTLWKNRYTHPLFDTKGWVADFEVLLSRLWAKHAPQLIARAYAAVASSSGGSDAPFPLLEASAELSPAHECGSEPSAEATPEGSNADAPPASQVGRHAGPCPSSECVGPAPDSNSTGQLLWPSHRQDRGGTYCVHDDQGQPHQPEGHGPVVHSSGCLFPYVDPGVVNGSLSGDSNQQPQDRDHVTLPTQSCGWLLYQSEAVQPDPAAQGKTQMKPQVNSQASTQSNAPMDPQMKTQANICSNGYLLTQQDAKSQMNLQMNLQPSSYSSGSLPMQHTHLHMNPHPNLQEDPQPIQTNTQANPQPDLWCFQPTPSAGYLFSNQSVAVADAAQHCSAPSHPDLRPDFSATADPSGGHYIQQEDPLYARLGSQACMVPSASPLRPYLADSDSDQRHLGQSLPSVPVETGPWSGPPSTGLPPHALCAGVPVGPGHVSDPEQRSEYVPEVADYRTAQQLCVPYSHAPSGSERCWAGPWTQPHRSFVVQSLSGNFNDPPSNNYNYPPSPAHPPPQAEPGARSGVAMYSYPSPQQTPVYYPFPTPTPPPTLSSNHSACCYAVPGAEQDPQRGVSYFALPPGELPQGMYYSVQAGAGPAQTGGCYFLESQG